MGTLEEMRERLISLCEDVFRDELIPKAIVTKDTDANDNDDDSNDLLVLEGEETTAEKGKRIVAEAAAITADATEGSNNGGNKHYDDKDNSNDIATGDGDGETEVEKFVREFDVASKADVITQLLEENEQLKAMFSKLATTSDGQEEDV